ncbi:MAG: hypothetical protein IJE03_04345 [Ruminiclostridium sp.]|nr:hypothetical protein [Ruminiclostridium sp.]MBQ9853009.1 hypothetical protein [Ruminiclostridium sp.]MBQ9933494.1 hypothetical protein [Ruminiclostridium sp.]
MNTYQKIQWLAWMITGLSVMGIAMWMLTGSQVGPVLAVSHIAMSLILASLCGVLIPMGKGAGEVWGDVQKKLILQVLILVIQAGTYAYLLVGHGENVALILLQLLGYFACLRTVPAVKKAEEEA